MVKLKKFRKQFVVVIYKFGDAVRRILSTSKEKNLVIKIKVILQRSLVIKIKVILQRSLVVKIKVILQRSLVVKIKVILQRSLVVKIKVILQRSLVVKIKVILQRSLVVKIKVILQRSLVVKIKVILQRSLVVKIKVILHLQSILKNVNRLACAQLNINSIRNKFDSLVDIVKSNIDILMISETNWIHLFLLDSFTFMTFLNLIGWIEIVMVLEYYCIFVKIYLQNSY